MREAHPRVLFPVRTSVLGHFPSSVDPDGIVARNRTAVHRAYSLMAVGIAGAQSHELLGLLADLAQLLLVALGRNGARNEGDVHLV